MSETERYACDECVEMAKFYSNSYKIEVGLLADLLQAVYDMREAETVQKRPWDELWAEGKRRFPQATEQNWRDAVFIVMHPIWVFEDDH